MADLSVKSPIFISRDGSDPPSVPPSMSIDQLLPALLECFGIILCGYVAGRTNIIPATQAKGLGSFVSKFALPALLFKNMVLLDFGDVIWPFFFSILVAKVTVFFSVCVLTLLVANRASRFSKAGLFSIFATQSNDFALGFPIGFVFCEVQRWRNGEPHQKSKLQVVGLVLLQVVKNPIVFMVVIGVISHFLLGQKIPPFMAEFVDGLANSFGGAALFYLGLTMFIMFHYGFIILCTRDLFRLVMPLICRGMVEVLDCGNRSSVNHTSLSNYAFLYGVFPTAPSVAIYASHYNMELEVVTSGMVISTFLSAPIMYVSAWLLTIPWMDSDPLASPLQRVSFNISIISLFALVWSVAVMLLSRKFHRIPHIFTINLFVAQLLTCVGMIAWNFMAEQDNFLGQVLTFTLLYGSLYSTYIWPGLIALTLLLMRKHEDVNFRPGLVVITGWGVPVLAVSVLLLTGKRLPNTIDSAFFYGKTQVICTSVVLFVSIVLCGVSLTLLSRQSRDYHSLEHGSLSENEEDVRLPYDTETQNSVEQPYCQCACGRLQSAPDITSTKEEASIQTGQCGQQCTSTNCLLVEEEQKVADRQNTDIQSTRHVLVCLLLTISLLANLSSCLWWLFNKDPGRLYLELQFFCVVVNYGQGWGQEVTGSAPSEEIRMTCSQFLTYHKEQCVRDIVHKKRCGKRSIAETFLGSDMVRWLQSVGLANDQGEALVYGSRLLEGGVIQHITLEHDFQDEALHYRFT
ncbi:Integral membrane protein GPR155 [Labeo rohita]|uniref:Integral membrane protein GPR155 n=1 Tax=Labeo rohita TaxID=84645 RepID=A0ABQ8MEV1_LABRO|nr:Integral membrane protein GPR155 [Labeo rohita]